MTTRTYRESDAYMLESATVTHRMLTDDLADFTPFDTAIDAAFLTSYIALINQGISNLSDNVIIDQQAQKTVEVLDLIKKARDKYAEVRYFSQKAFKDKPEVRNELGLNDYDKARRNQAQMILFLDEVHQICIKYAAQLNAAGMTMAQINEIKDIQNDLLSANTGQENFIKSRPTITQERAILYNAIFDITRQINEAAQIVYRNNEAKRNKYIYMHGGGGNDTNTPPTLTIPSGSILLVGNYPYDPARVFEVNNTGAVPLVFFMSNDGVNTVGNQVTVAPLSSFVITMAMFTDTAADKLMCQNTNETTVGTCEVDLV